MGVSGCGKSTIGKLLSEKTGLPFYDGDDFHPLQNIEKMSRGMPLDDEDRLPWLLTLHQLASKAAKDGGCIIACSALKENYRQILTNGLELKAKWYWLDGKPQLLSQRMKNRKHFMPATLLGSQLAALEVPANALRQEIKAKPQTIVDIISRDMEKKEFGVMGMGVMGRSIARNLANNGIGLSLFNRHVSQLEVKVASKTIQQYAELKDCWAFDKIPDFVNSLARPRKILLMVDAGKAVDEVLEKLLLNLQKGDMVMDGGNSHYTDTERRMATCKKRGILYMGVGISGGEKGALEGPAIMPGGDQQAYSLVKPYLEKIAAENPLGQKCCTYIGPEGSGHYVKMIHNGIEYAEMQLLCETYGILRYGMHKTPGEISKIFNRWNHKKNGSYLLEISARVLKEKKNDDWMIDKILDSAGSKGTGGWAALDAIERGHAFATMTAALFARYLSSEWKWRRNFSKQMAFPKVKKVNDITIKDLEAGLYLARLINHHLGFQQILKASKTNGWDVDLTSLASIWTNGCIIRSRLMEDIVNVFRTEDLLLNNEQIQDKIKKHRKSLIRTVQTGLASGQDMSCFSAAINFLNGAGHPTGTASLIQAQRDYFGAHTFKWIDDPEGRSVHFSWTMD